MSGHVARLVAIYCEAAGGNGSQVSSSGVHWVSGSGPGRKRIRLAIDVSGISLSEECAGTCVSRSSRLSLKGCNQSGMPRVGSSSFISSTLCAEPRFPEACLSGFVCVGFPHACLALRVVIGSDDVSDSPEELDCSFGLDVEAELLLEDDDNPGKTRGTKLSIIQVIVFPFWVTRGVSPFFHSYEHPCSEQKAYQAMELFE